MVGLDGNVKIGRAPKESSTEWLKINYPKLEMQLNQEIDLSHYSWLKIIHFNYAHITSKEIQVIITFVMKYLSMLKDIFKNGCSFITPTHMNSQDFISTYDSMTELNTKNKLSL